MARNGSGTYSRTQSDYAFNTVIQETQINSELNDIATEISASLEVSGKKTWTGNQNAGSTKITALAVGTVNTDSTTLGQSQNSGSQYATGSGTNTIVATMAPAITAYAAGQTFRIKMAAGANTGATTINLNSLGAKAITKKGTTALAAGDIPASTMFEIAYDGTRFQLLNVGTDAGITASSTDSLTNKTFDANATGNSLSNVDVADLAAGTDGQLITWGADAAPTTVAAGTSGHFLKSQGAGSVPVFAAGASGNLVDDTSPQLGGQLDVNGQAIGDGTLELLKFTETGSAVNEFTIANAASGSGPTLSATGDGTNVDINIAPKGTGDVVLAGDTVKVGDSGAAAVLTSNGAGTLTVTTGGTTDLILNTNSGTASSSIQITDAANGDIDFTCNGTGIINFNDRADYPQVAITSSSNATAWDAQAAPNAYHLTTENTTVGVPTNPATGAFISLNIKYASTHSMAFNTVFEFAASTTPTFTSATNKVDHFVFRYNGACWQEMGRNLNMAIS